MYLRLSGNDTVPISLWHGGGMQSSESRLLLTTVFIPLDFREIHMSYNNALAWMHESFRVLFCVLNIIKQVVKDFWRKAASQGNLSRRTLQCDINQCGALQPASQSRSRCCWFFCCVKCRALTPNAFQWGGQPPKLPLFVGDLDLHLIRSCIWPTRVTHPDGILIGSAIFAGLMNVTNGHRQTHRQRYSVCSNRPHLVHWAHAMRFKNRPTCLVEMLNGVLLYGICLIRALFLSR